MPAGNGNIGGDRNISEKNINIQNVASAIEDLLYMEAIKVKDVRDQKINKAILSSQFAVTVSNVIPNMNLNEDNDDLGLPKPIWK
jgi:hypothetical protein